MRKAGEKDGVDLEGYRGRLVLVCGALGREGAALAALEETSQFVG